MRREGQREIAQVIPEHRPFEHARTAWPGRQRKLDPVERSSLAGRRARQRGKRMRFVLNCRRLLFLRESLVFFCFRRLLLSDCPRSMWPSTYCGEQK